MSDAQHARPEQASPATTLVLTAALAHFFDRPHEQAGSARSDDILRVAIAGELTARR